MDALKLRFGMPEVAHWAEFSGDYNPIHFDLPQARTLGSEALIVHGMLALLPIKRWLAETQAAPAAAAPWQKFRALLRTPIPHDEDLQVTQRLSAAAQQFRVHDMNGGDEYFRGSLAAATDPWSDYAGRGDVGGSSELTAERLASFARFYPAPYAPWIVIDALVFADFMRNKLATLREYTQPRMERAFGAGSGHGLIVHASHTITYCRAGLLKATAGGSPLSYAALEPDLLDGSGQLVCSIPMRVCCGDEAFMAIEIGLVIKAPTTPEPVPAAFSF